MLTGSHGYLMFLWGITGYLTSILPKKKNAAINNITPYVNFKLR